MHESFVEAAMSAYGDTVLRAASSVTGNRADAEDVFSDVFFALYRQHKVFYSEQHLKAWLIRTAVNKAKNVTASTWSKRRDELDENIPYHDVYADDEVLQALQKLSKAERAAVYLHYYEGYSFQEIAPLLGMREGSVRSTAFRARAALKQLLPE